MDKMGCSTSLSITNSRSLLKLMSIDLVMPSNHLILHRPLFLQPSIFPWIRDFSNESVLQNIRWPKYWSFSFSNSSSNEYSGMIFLNIGTDFLYKWLVGSHCSPRDSQESSLTPQLKSINSGTLLLTFSISLSFHLLSPLFIPSLLNYCLHFHHLYM